ncbi:MULTISPECIES: UDP-glucose 4-epimerase GalE [unclassified Rhizobium]|uniref:UDP-glucose 4-epimerase GalE n=1 Tax=unclassified Rhizobium TaxID=2613769 RepID=UPI001ADA0C55|nr:MULTISPECIES: UDP-glucose 4-epimerase GalE [unclassified Rhizobium]MBO9100298.1 UDP-glucose 4-epimerase GalE [Rhizobium sp. L58/93]MBO9135544.1 UDP-glucose 4-epimerase GalE [Rhizobium sp. B209b/85]MBO9186191.1 UDP-glucose 4-epimerase GalE [Rhizobium sp. E27B/91]QXZ83113.1 UDP-glucose 4-epimerase GalE [Rhizobium sp. K1/93]QXZ89375.1 UDP-glucose 4-epimerase GalE [Rhizobium sp. K15/93]
MAGETILVVGGAGYIGSHTCLDLANKGFVPVVYDNFSNGHREFVRWGPVEEGDIRDRARLDEVIARHKPAAILHFAALIEVGESVKDPVAFYENNVVGTLTLLSAAQAAGIKAFVFSSTCATYGLPQSVPLDETHRQVPINPYGQTKYIVEQALADYDRYTGFRSVILRYFNAAGADFEGRVGEWHKPETHAIPLAIDAALGRRAGFKVFGSDYETRDGTCVRDYIHVLDLADAHVRAVQYLLDGGDSVALNLGTGTGTTVKELLSAIEDVTGKPFPVEYAGRREGDSTTLVANNDHAKAVLGWVPQYDLSQIIQSAWNWHAKSNHH